MLNKDKIRVKVKVNKVNDLNNLVNNLSNHPKEDNGTPRNHTETEFLSQDNKEVKVNREVNKVSALNKNRTNLRLTLKALTDLSKVSRITKVLKMVKEDNGMPKNLTETEFRNQDNKEDREASPGKVINQAREARTVREARTDKGLSQDSRDRDLSLDNRDRDLNQVNRDRALSPVNQDSPDNLLSPVNQVNPDSLLSLVRARMVIKIKVKARIKALKNLRRTIRIQTKEINQAIKAIKVVKVIKAIKMVKLVKETKADREISPVKVLNLDRVANRDNLTNLDNLDSLDNLINLDSLVNLVKLRMDRMTMLRKIQDQVRKIIIQITTVTIWMALFGILMNLMLCLDLMLRTLRAMEKSILDLLLHLISEITAVFATDWIRQRNQPENP